MKSSLNGRFDNIKCVLCDIDNTLLDFGKSSQLAIIRTCEDFNMAYPNQIFDVFVKVTNDMWRQIQDGEMTEELLRERRWNAIFDILGISADGPAFEDIFDSRLHDCAVPVDGAIDALEYLHSKYAVYTASNASYKQQHHRLELSGMLQYIDGIFVSEQCGFQKPNKQFFEACLNRLDCSPSETLMIGDDVHADIYGASAYGLHTCWYNPKHLVNNENISADVEIEHLSELKLIL